MGGENLRENDEKKYYKYYSVDTASYVLDNNNIYYTPIKELNDPFEFVWDKSVPQDSSEIFNKVLKQMVDNSFVFSMSKVSPSDVNAQLLWSHYGDAHKGVCLEFEVTNEDVVEVDYSNKFHSFNEDEKRYIKNVKPNEPFNILDYKPFFEKIGRIKSKVWAYEGEYRLLQYVDVLFQNKIKVDKKNNNDIGKKELLDYCAEGQEGNFQRYGFLATQDGYLPRELSKGLIKITAVYLGARFEREKYQSLIEKVESQNIDLIDISCHEKEFKFNERVFSKV